MEIVKLYILSGSSLIIENNEYTSNVYFQCFKCLNTSHFCSNNQRLGTQV